MGKNRMGETLVSMGTDHSGAVVENNCAIEASVIILPGRHVPANSIIQAERFLGNICKYPLKSHSRCN